MKNKISSYLTFLTILFLIACQSQKTSNQASRDIEKSKETPTKAEEILAQTIAAHGGQKYDYANYEFVFRKNKYSFKNEGKNFYYTSHKEKDGQKIIDVLDNDTFTRTVNGQQVKLADKERNSATGSINSVIYFATLPHKLQDPAVNVSYIGTTKIKGQNYEVLEITFSEEGGGTDHDDQYYYWINQATQLIDYLAYNYQVNKGGVRFRKAYNTRNVDGIIFQDYVNYKAPLGTPLANLPKLFEEEALQKLSVIETEQIVNLQSLK